MAKLTGPLLVGDQLNLEQTYTITFDFNPKSIEVKHGVGVKDRKNGQGSDGSSGQATNIDKLGLPQLNLKETTFYGASTLKYCEQLNAWSFAAVPSGDGNNEGTKLLPPLKFQWGSFELRGQSVITATLASVTISYERFTATGVPIRANVTISLQPQTAGQRGQQNPTSGGLPNRSGHVLSSGETLAGLALAKYGNPARWRALAEENQLDDPLRVQPGSVLYVPSRAELADRGIG
jgi:Contractile injection system tube protein